ncbi:phytanoyl-CoA dioxygenase family protein [Aquihabitans sp. G128]|uniref:phytanoyl-CoA dioxygenase family protein n=1 Tax=Aquihabitans sp. G128 TaxID=2849779 RepID=UPI001C214ABA|nr:phytanoyl-CoA dioxygenase family protein [Aquihabitans sp. G128]QXC60297.1 phytanoyl-CoA dioxygenase family protein [Aquihabitans sp. G128]
MTPVAATDGARGARTQDRRTHFCDAAVNDQLARTGYAVLPQRLTRHAVAELAELHRLAVREVGADDSGHFYPSMMITSPSVRARLWDGVQSITEPFLAPLFEPGAVEVLGGPFVSKPASPNSFRLPHQDPTSIDERRHVSLSVWVPLVDSTRENGALEVLAGSHLMGNHPRPPDVESLHPDLAAEALRSSTAIELEAGSMMVIDGAVIHHSLPNRTDRGRVAAIAGVIPQGHELYYVRSDAGAEAGTAEVHAFGIEGYRSGDLRAPGLDERTLVERLPYRLATLEDLARSQAAASGTTTDDHEPPTAGVGEPGAGTAPRRWARRFGRRPR